MDGCRTDPHPAEAGRIDYVKALAESPARQGASGPRPAPAAGSVRQPRILT